MNYPTNTWQELGWSSSGAPDFWYFCNNVTNLNAQENITQIDYALAQYTNGEPWTNLGNYANYFKIAVLPICEDGDVNSSACFGTQNGMTSLISPRDANPSIVSFWADVSNTGTRSYLYTSIFTPIRQKP